jgi:hypothetical protein
MCTMHALMRGTWRRGLLKVAPITALGVIGILVAAPAASGQAAIDQYIPAGDPGNGAGKDAGGVAGSLLPPGGPGQPPSPNPGGGSSGGGKLPLTGYPVTPFVWVILAVLLIGAMVRIAAPVLGRRGAPDA